MHLHWHKLQNKRIDTTLHKLLHTPNVIGTDRSEFRRLRRVQHLLLPLLTYQSLRSTLWRQKMHYRSQWW